MNSTLHRSLATATLAAALVLQPVAGRAEIVSTDQVAAQHQADADRTKVQAFLDRANVKERLQAMGVDGVFARDRVAALSDQEVHALAQKIDTLPAGGSLSETDLIIILLIAILVAIAV